MSNLETSKKIMKYFNSRNFDGIIKCLADDDYIWTDELKGEFNKDTFKSYLEWWIKLVKDVKITNLEFNHCNDKVFIELSGKGTRNNKPFDLNAIIIHQYDVNGKLKKGKIIYDGVALIEQTGTKIHMLGV